MITDKEGYEVTEESPVLVADQYEYQTSSASKTAVLKSEGLLPICLMRGM